MIRCAQRVTIFLIIAVTLAKIGTPSVAQTPYTYRVFLPYIARGAATYTPEQEHSLALHNQARASIGVRALTLDPGLTAAAQAHADDMAANNYYSHTSLDGRSPWDRMRDAGVSFGYAAENIGKGWIGGRDNLAVIESLFDQMMAETPPDDAHRQIILSPTYRRLGVGVAVRDGWLYWVCDFAD